MRVLVATARKPFVRDDTDALASGLIDALRAAGHEADLLALPHPPRAEHVVDHLLACRLLAAGGADRLVALKFPASCLPHPDKVLWLTESPSPADAFGDELEGDPDGLAVREAVRRADAVALGEARAVFAVSAAFRAGVPVLYHPPPDAGAYQARPAESFFLFADPPGGRLSLLREAVALARHPVELRIVGPDAALAERRDLFARCLGVVALAETGYAYPALEAMLARRPVVTCPGTPAAADFVQSEVTGLVGAGPVGLATALDRLWEDRALARDLGEAGRAAYDELDISWPAVVRRLAA